MEFFTLICCKICMKKTKIIRKKSKDGPFKKVNQLFLEGIQTKRYSGLFHVTDYKCNERLYNVMLPGILSIFLVNPHANNGLDDGLARQNRAALLGIHCILHPELLVDLDAV